MAPPVALDGSFTLFSPIALGAVTALVLLAIIARTLIRGLSSPLNAIPGPISARFTNLPLKGAVLTGNRIHYIHALHQRYGPYVRVSPTEVSVASPQGFQQIHKINSGYNKTQWYQDLTFMDRPVLFTTNDAHFHSRRRKLFARAFSKTHLRQHWEKVVEEKVKLAVSRMHSDAKTHGVTDVLEWWTFMATDVSAHLMFGESFRMLEKGEVNEYVRVLQNALKGGGIGSELPFVRELCKYIPVRALKETFRANDTLDEHAQIAVKNARNPANENARNIFATIIAESDKEGGGLDDRDVNLEAQGLIVAGSDTTAISLTYLVWAVCGRPDVQAKLEKEVADLPEGYDEASLEECELLNAVIEETLRLYGAAPGGLPRNVPAGGAVMEGYTLPQGTIVTTQAYSLHRDPSLYPDPEKFLPERWIKGRPEELSDAARSVFHAFGAGSRTCLGIHLARMEMRLATAEFFRVCKGARRAGSATEACMEMENFFLISPRGHKCEMII